MSFSRKRHGSGSDAISTCKGSVESRCGGSSGSGGGIGATEGVETEFEDIVTSQLQVCGECGGLRVRRSDVHLVYVNLMLKNRNRRDTQFRVAGCTECGCLFSTRQE